ncbi:MAG: PD-(D/E)XK nuclease-like domain-containing protein [Ruminococcus sp.]|nr:PD-(D/E)XK nuclease-like domain-containing protein [Ruminococcus sp.]MCM1380306.1 PD-(D/E)XK nuclease-like domain-containing protein [Muribaculaceae bacterium]MCM1478286.1 PD-(D/E)XK nuclease-like domain-containing protein [Muribaculaceae bacterium]
MTEKEYREHPAVSRSELWRISESPEKFRYYKDNPPKSTPALTFGQAFHKAVLLTDEFDGEFAVAPQVDRRTKDGKTAWAAFEQSAEGKTVISADDWETIAAMRDKLFSDEYSRRLLSGEHEKEFFWTDDLTSEPCKCRADALCEAGGINIIADVKTAADARTEPFTRKAFTYGYHMQAAMYLEGVKAVTGKDCEFVFIVIEKEPPYAVNIIKADKNVIERGYNEFRRLLGIYHECKESGDWYGYLGKLNIINTLSVPSWLAGE